MGKTCIFVNEGVRQKKKAREKAGQPIYHHRAHDSAASRRCKAPSAVRGRGRPAPLAMTGYFFAVSLSSLFLVWVIGMVMPAALTEMESS